MNKKIHRLVIRGIKVPLRKENFDYDTEAVFLALKKLKSIRFRYAPDLSDKSLAVYKKSVDARKKNAVCFVYSVIFSLKQEIMASESEYSDFCAFCSKHGIAVLDEEKINFFFGGKRALMRPVVAGFGPCGMFIALILAKAGFRPIVIERGFDVDTRGRDVERYWKNGTLSSESNVQFGEGGAGTFSDGKLMTRINDPLCAYVLETFFAHGASKDILFSAKPHVGTDKLREIVKNIRNTIISHGGEVRFGTRLDGIERKSDGSLAAVITSNGRIETDALFLAVGHSARDTFAALMRDGIIVSAKPFSVGVRVEHLQENINRALYGEMYDNPALPQGEYSLSRRYGGRAVYSFCMCPGGTVVASASEDESIVTNGMSYSARDGKNANSAIAVSIDTNDFGGDVLSAMEFQRNIERAAFSLGGSDGSAPIENLGHFLGRSPLDVTDVLPTYTGKTKLCDIKSIFPSYVSEMLRSGFQAFEHNIEGFSCDSAILTAPETRTSSPVRVNRNECFEALGCCGLYPCGEGAGYAGGITSAAVDGIRSALSYIGKYKPL